MSERLEHAIQAWGEVPAWVQLLIQECDMTSQGKAAKRLGLSSATISQTIRNNYRGNLENVRGRVEDILDTSVVNCPALGQITSKGCLDWRDLAKRGGTTIPLRVRMQRACRLCPRNAKKEGTE
jgi:DNA-binding transcriptional regulator YdaS (Cro superfamily)